jgi:CspA family cold shock protein
MHIVKGHGFITQDDGGPDVFVHHSKVSGKGKDALDQGDLVSYQVHETVKGPAASSVAKR